MGWLDKLRNFGQNLTFDRLAKGVQDIQFGVYVRVKKHYTLIFEGDKTSLLAAAVSNLLFSREATTEAAKSFATENQDLIASALAELPLMSGDTLVAINRAVRVAALCDEFWQTPGRLTPDERLDNLERHSCLLPDVEIPTDPFEFEKYAKAYRAMSESA